MPLCNVLEAGRQVMVPPYHVRLWTFSQAPYYPETCVSVCVCVCVCVCVMRAERHRDRETET